METEVASLIVEVLSQIEKLEQNDEEFLGLAAALHQLKTLNKSVFKQVYGWPRLGRRKAFYLVAIDRAFSKSPELRPRLIKIGWTKLGLIASAVNAENVHDLLAYAEAHTAKEIEIGFKKVGEGQAFRQIKLILSAEQYATFANVVQVYGAKQTKTGFDGAEEIIMAALESLGDPVVL